MVVKVFCVYDSKVQAYLPPFYMQSAGGAVRAFEDTVADESTQLAKHPEDYTLFEIGEFDDQTGIISQLPAKVSLGCALEYKRRPPVGVAPVQVASGG